MSENPFDLTGSVVLITGSSRGIGASIARGLANGGATVVLHGRDDITLADGAAALRSETGANVGHVAFDVTEEGSVARGVRQVLDEHGRIDGLVNNAGMQLRKPLVDVTLEDWNLVMNTNVTSAFLVGREVGRAMVERGSGAIVNICSIQSDLARPSIAPYTASKGALRNLTRAMTAEWAASGVRTNAIAPGYLKTEMTKALVADPEFSGWVERRTPAGRWGSPEDLVGAAIFLLSPASSFVAGQMLFVDGGMSVVV